MSAEDNGDDILKGISNVAEESTHTEEEASFSDNCKQKASEPPSIIKEVSEAIMERYRLLTIEETKEIWYYRDGVYVPGGDILIEKEAEAIYGYELANRHLVEIKGHIMRKTYHHSDIDADINIVNLKNGLYNLQTGEFKEHSQDYLSINQAPIVYNRNAWPKRFGKFLYEVLHPSEIRTAIELMAYTFYRDNPFEIIAILFGYGANGKGVFTGLLTTLHGPKKKPIDLVYTGLETAYSF